MDKRLNLTKKETEMKDCADTTLYCKLNSIVYKARVVEKGKSDEGYSHPDIVDVYIADKKLVGYQKKDINECNRNDMEQLLYSLSKIINIPLALNVRLYIDKKCTIPYSSVSISVETVSTEAFVSFKDMRDELYNDIVAGAILTDEWIKEWYKIKDRRKTNQVNLWEVEAICASDYIYCIRFPFDVARLWAQKNGVSLVDFDLSIIKMVLFDVLIGQADRTPSNYGILVNKSKNSARLAPLFDNSTITKPYVRDNMNSFNNLLLYRDKFCSYLKQYFGNIFFDEAKFIASKKQDMLMEIEKFSHILQKNDYELLHRRIIEGCAIFESIDKVS